MKITGIQKVNNTFIVRVLTESSKGFEVFDHVYLHSDGGWSIRFDYETTHFSSKDLSNFLKVIEEAKLKIKNSDYVDMSAPPPKVEGALEPLVDYGCYVTVIDGVLYECPMDTSKAPIKDAMTEVSAPQSEDFLYKVNYFLGTKFKMEDFSGR